MMNDETQRKRIRSLREGTTRLEHEGDYWTNHEKEDLIRDFNSGVGITEMADKFRRSEPAVMQQIEKLDLYHRKDNPRRRRHGRRGRCLCGTCRLDGASCVRCSACKEGQEGA